MNNELFIRKILGLIDIPCAYKSDAIFIENDLFKKTSISASITNLKFSKCKPIITKVDHIHLLILPIYGNESNSSYYFVINGLNNEKQFVVDEKIWHEINNPLAVLTMMISRLTKKSKLEQEDVDKVYLTSKNQLKKIKDGISTMVCEVEG